MLGGLVNGIDSFMLWLNSAFKQNLSDYSDLETAQDEFTLVTRDGSLLSVLRINGYKSIVNVEAFYENISKPIADSLDGPMSKNGHAFQILFSMDPTRSFEVVGDALAPAYKTIEKLNMDLKEILDEKVSTIANIANFEECFIVLWTRPGNLVPNDLAEESKRKLEARKKIMTPTGNGQDPLAANNMLINQHSSFVSNMEKVFYGVNLDVDVLDVVEATRAVRASINYQVTGKNWTPSLPGDPIRPVIRREKHNADEWDIVWPKISWQVCPSTADIVNNKVVQVGNLVYAPAYVDLLPKDVIPFTDLFNTLGNKFPWRISFWVEADGLSAVAMRGLFASILGFSSESNKLLNKGVNALKVLRDEYQQNAVKIRIAFCTWTDKDKISNVERNIAELSRAVESWGGCLVSEVTGDPVAGVVSSALAFSSNSVATVSAAPLDAVTFMLPLSRPSSPWLKGSVLFLSPDMKLMPYQPGSSEQSTWVSLIFAKPGSGKSVLMNILNFASCVAPGIERLPRIGIVDIGPSSSGLISLLKESLPIDKRHLVQYYRLRMTEDYCVNPFDTQLGCRFPTSEELAFLNNFVLLLATDPNKETPEEGMTGLVQAVIEDMYYDTSEKGKPKRYDKGTDYYVDAAVEDLQKYHGFELDNETTWWEVVDKLFDVDNYHAAVMAQRYAVPLLADAASSAQKEKIRNIYGKVIVSTGENLIEYFNRSLTGALNQYKILGRPTVFDIGEARVVSLDLDEVAKTGGAQADRQTAVMYLFARYILGKDFKLGVDTVNEMPYPSHMEITVPTIPVKKYKVYHKKRAEDIKEDYKRLCFDEFHRTSKSQMVRDQIIVDMREGRKWKIDVTLASQALKDFDETMCSFTTSIFVMDGGTEQDIEELVETFGMDDPAEKWALQKGKVHPPRNGPGVFMAKFFTNSGKYTQLLQAYVGPIEMWALNTTAEDAAIRNKMYEKIGPVNARKILAKEFPRGVAKYIAMRRENLRNTGMMSADDDSNIYNQIIDELLSKYKMK